MDIQPRTYYRGLYGRESDVVLYPLLTVHVSPIYARSEYVYPPECEPSRGIRGGEGEYWTREKAEFRIVWGYYFMEVRVLWPDPRRYAGVFWIMYTVDRSCLPIRETDYSNGTMAPVILEFPGRVIEISYRHFSLEPTMIDTFLADCRILQPVSKLRIVVNYSLGWLDGIGGPPLNEIGEQRYLSSTSNPRFTVEWL